MPNGRVKWFNKVRRSGFIKQDDGQEFFVHASAIKWGIQTLEKGQKVQFEIVQGPDGLQAVNVVKLQLLS